MSTQDCIFCKIIKGEIPCAEIYSDDNVLAFLDIGPVNKGHTLIIPKQHYGNIFDIPAELAPAIINAQKIVGKAILATTGATGLNIFMNNHPDAGQLVFHAHWHLIPRFSDDGLKHWQQVAYDSIEEAQHLATSIRQHI